MASTALASCGDSYFTFGWDEDVLLHDGVVVVASVKYAYQRLGALPLLNRYEPSIMRSTQFSFDAGPPLGKFAQTFEKHRVDVVERVGEKWLLVLQRSGGLYTIETPQGRVEAWGSVEDGSGHKCLALSDKGLAQARMQDLPEGVTAPNMLMDNVQIKELARLHGTHVTLKQKAELLSRFPLSPAEEWGNAGSTQSGSRLR